MVGQSATLFPHGEHFYESLVGNTEPCRVRGAGEEVGEAVNVVGRGMLEDFKRRHADARGPLDSWLSEAEAAEWRSPEDIKARYPSASIIAGGRVVFNIKGNSYRLDVKIAYQTQVLIVVRIGTHAEYDNWEL